MCHGTEGDLCLACSVNGKDVKQMKRSEDREARSGIKQISQLPPSVDFGLRRCPTNLKGESSGRFSGYSRRGSY